MDWVPARENRVPERKHWRVEAGAAGPLGGYELRNGGRTGEWLLARARGRPGGGPARKYDLRAEVPRKQAVHGKVLPPFVQGHGTALHALEGEPRLLRDPAGGQVVRVGLDLDPLEPLIERPTRKRKDSFSDVTP